ncbi:hypothetical protein EBAPG3_010230 [Nitrosospira lacus]|uniref:PEP-CTERM protein-sorting domain-containing protein n=2 Tax=Nitrosospira lacus TaxID=1288494 RepID=A0A1W6SQQ2_9PROT|nr:hypothetical protein EBAPG3_010230 [Nitrosospira lacus]
MDLRKLFFAILSMMLATTSHAIIINADGGGAVPAMDVKGLDWAPGNTMLTPVGNASIFSHPLGDVFQLYTHASLGGFLDSNGGGIGSPGSNGWTYIAGYQQQVVSTVGNRVVLGTIAGGDNFFRLYFDPTPDANAGNGTGFGPDATNSDPILILSGTVNASVGQTAISARNVPPGSLDNFGPDNYPGVESITAVGSSALRITVESLDPLYFPVGLAPGMGLDFQTLFDTPFSRADPSSCFTNGAGMLINGAGPNTLGGLECGINTVGSINGINGANLILMSDSSAIFTQVAPLPEPISLVLLGVGLAAMGAGKSRRKTIRNEMGQAGHLNPTGGIDGI